VVRLIRDSVERDGQESMTGQRRRFTASFKTRVVIEAIRGQKTLGELASQFEVHPNQIRQWRQQALEALPGIFAQGNGKQDKAQEELLAQLYQQIGQLKVELDWLKKNSGLEP
jgi:putative transposase